MAEGTERGDARNHWRGGSLQQEIHRLVHDAVAQAFAEAEAQRPAPLPVAVSVAEAARLISVGETTIDTLIDNGRLRLLDLGGTRRRCIPTVALFGLDPQYRAGLAEIDRIRSGFAIEGDK